MYIGIDIGGTTIKFVLTDKKGNVLSFKKIPTEKNAQEIEDGICRVIEELKAFNEIAAKKVKGIGIGAAGAIDKAKGIILTSANIQAWKKYPLVKLIEGRTGIRTFLENDATAALIGELWLGNGKNFSNWIMLTLGTGIGGGVVINGKVYTGRSGSAMEVGHTTIDYKGRKCSCGNRGCFERYASATAVIETAKSRLKKYPESSVNKRIKNENLTSKLLYDEALKGDPFSNEIFAEISEYLGIGISNLISIFNPEAVILAGGLSRAHKIIFPIVKKVVQERVQAGLKENIKYLLIKDEEKTPALGAAKTAIECCA
ncbi:MAG: ROK family protein [Spirochaetes bacterium]|nr:ROK family protein [Spirochaetota bacterium]